MDVILYGFLSALALSSVCHAAGTAPTVGFYHLEDQRLSGKTTIVDTGHPGFILSLLVTIDTAGKVIAAKPLDNREWLDPAPALAAVRNWTFRPQKFEGKAVNAVGEVHIRYLAPPAAPDTNISFPKAAPSDFEITLRRGACLGDCPDYQVTVFGSGLVSFDTGDDHFKGTVAEIHLQYNGHHVLLPGRHTAHIAPAAAAGLLAQFRTAHFFGLKRKYTFWITDQPTQELSVRVGKTRKTVTDYVGRLAGMPKPVKALEKAVDRVAGTSRWVDGNRQSLAYLDATHFDDHAPSAVWLAVAAAENMRWFEGPGDLIEGLIARGLPLNASVKDETLGTLLIRAAAKYADEKLFKNLSQRGALAAVPHKTLTGIFRDVGCSPLIARALVRAGADPRGGEGNRTPLTALSGSHGICAKYPAKEPEMIRTLLKLGVPLEAHNTYGWTALMGCDSPERARQLLAAGADPRAHDKDGTTPLLSTDEDRVALILLRAGADPRAKDSNGTVRDQARKYHMAATLRWLDAHGIP